jgi:hypothetical protein
MGKRLGFIKVSIVFGVAVITWLAYVCSGLFLKGIERRVSK